MHCRVNQIPFPERARTVQGRIEAMLQPFADRIETFDLTAPQDEASVYLTVRWRDQQRPATVVPIHDESAPDFESETLSLLGP